MKNLKFLTPIFATLFFISCDDGFEKVENRVIVSKSFVMGYERFEEPILQPTIIVWNDTAPKTIRLDLTNSLETAIQIVAHEECNLKDNDLARYQKLCEKNGDTTYNRKTPLYNVHKFIDKPANMVFDYDLEKISIVSDADFDAEHAAGAELGDIVEYVGFSPYKFIKDGYALSNIRKKQNFINDRENFGFQIIEKRVSELTSEDLKMLGENHDFGYLYFPLPPTKSKSHNFTIRLTTDEGKTFEAKCLVEF